MILISISVTRVVTSRSFQSAKMFDIFSLYSLLEKHGMTWYAFTMILATDLCNVQGAREAAKDPELSKQKVKR